MTETRPTRAAAALNLPTDAAGGKELTPLDRRIQRTQAMLPSLENASKGGVDPRILVRDATTALRNLPDLVKCDETSFFGALMTAAQLGLRPNIGPLGHGWILPYWNGRAQRHEAKWILGYQGMVELGYRSGLVSKITSDSIYANETYRIKRGTADELVHEPILNETERGDVVAHYAIVWLQTGQCLWKVMGEDAVQALMNRHAPRNKSREIVGPWRDDYIAMAQKSPLRALWRFMPKTEILSLALATDTVVRKHDADKPAEVTLADDADDTANVDTTTGEVLDPPADETEDERIERQLREQAQDVEGVQAP